MEFAIKAIVDYDWKIINMAQYSISDGTAIIIGQDDDTYSTEDRNIVEVIVSPDINGTTIIGGSTRYPFIYVNSLNAALNWCANAKKNNLYGINSCVVVGPSLYKEAIISPYLRLFSVSTLDTEIGTKPFPTKLLSDFECIHNNLADTHNGRLYLYRYCNSDELKFHSLLERLLTAPLRQNRTDIPTQGVFHKVLKFKLYDANRGKILPLLTTKRVPWKSIYHELIWFLRGSTNTEYLKEHNIPIWDGNSSREYLNKRGLANYEPGELGPIYGAQWRHWGKPYFCKARLKQINELLPQMSMEPGVDQIAAVINRLKTDPWDRRMIVNSWSVDQLDQMSLPPCHYAFQFHVDPDNSGAPTFLNCLVNMRSADVFLGVPFNIASYSLLTHIIAHLTGLTPGTLSISMADCHIYVNHIDGIKEMINRIPLRFPTILFGPEITSDATIDDFTNKFMIDDYIINDYRPYPFIKVPMAI